MPALDLGPHSLLICKVEQMISVIWKVPFVSGMFWTMLLLCFWEKIKSDIRD